LAGVSLFCHKLTRLAEFLNAGTDIQKANWLEQNPMNWAKKRARKVKITSTFQELSQSFQKTKTICN
jgi:hypothetical protein